MAGTLVKAKSSAMELPALFAPDKNAAKRFIEFFTANIRNPNTRRAYARAAVQFALWCEQNDLRELADIEPMHVAAYIEVLQTRLAAPSVKQHLAAVRMLFDWLVVGQVVAVNPASPVRGPKYSVKKGKLHEKGGKRHEMPCHHNLDAYLHAYIDAVGIAGNPKNILFPTALGRTGLLSNRTMAQPDAYRMIGRRALEAGIATKIGNHSFLGAQRAQCGSGQKPACNDRDFASDHVREPQ